MAEKIIFGQFDSEKLGLMLTERSAPLPEEKRVIENIPFSDGVEDYSQIFGKFFNERELNYTFVKMDANYDERKQLEAKIKHLASSYNYVELYDTHDLGYYFKAKLMSATFVNDAQNQMLTCQLGFKAQPYMYRNNDSYEDVWDSFNFDVDIAQIYDFNVQSYLKTFLVIPEAMKVEPIFELISGEVTLKMNEYSKVLKVGKNATPYIVFDGVFNEFSLIGHGRVKIHYDRGEMR
ncbi:hypothetical protein [Lactococcus garvieae]|uniref:Phage tail protein n=1 Tax=Lactococcus garvieae TaxID=1363 RepID=A0A1I4J281_9LACT|nr:hypothetical protein [Lactococcus garvieae]SFL60705.1 hypothetical protein SAMN05216438_1273 [Lactococcus garvieae]